MFPVTSRYATVETAKLTLPDGREIVYLRRRFPPRVAAVPLAEHLVTESDRLDNVTAVEASLAEQGIGCLIGRNVLQHGILLYQGHLNQFTLAF